MLSGGFRTDANHKQIAGAFRAFGAKVITLHHAGHGVPDLLVVFRGNSYFAEIKTAKGKLKKEQAQFIADVRHSVVVRSTSDVELFFKNFEALRLSSLKEAQEVLAGKTL